MATMRGEPCRACDGAEETKHVALIPFVDGEAVTEPHQYAVGDNCYIEQWGKVYPKEKCPIQSSTTE